MFDLGLVSLAKHSQDTPEEDKFGGGVGGGRWICPEVSRLLFKVVVLSTATG